MPWSLEYLPTENIVETIFEGDLKSQEVRDAVIASVEMAKQNNAYRFLADCTTMQGSGDAFDIYQLGELIQSIVPGRDVREAVLLPVGTPAVADLEFYETVTANRGFNVRLFAERGLALKWLAE